MNLSGKITDGSAYKRGGGNSLLDFYLSAAFVMYISLVVGSYLTGNGNLIRTLYALSFFLLPVSFAFFRFRARSHELLTLTFVFFLIKLYLLKTLVTGDEIYAKAFAPLAGISIALMFYRLLDNNPRALLKILYIIFFGTFLYIVHQFFFLSVNPNDIFLGGSRNHITDFLLAVFVLWALSYTKVNLKQKEPEKIQSLLGYLLVLLTIGLLITLTGRTGVLISGFMLIWVITISFYQPGVFRKIKYKRILNVCFVIGAGAIAFIYISPYVEFFAINRLLESGLESRGRLIVNSYFIENLSSGFFGLPYYSVQTAVGLTWHSSFIEIVVHYGFIGMVTAIIYLLYAIFHSVRKRPIAGMLVIPILFRSFFDDSLFNPLLIVAFFVWVLIVTEPKLTK